MELQSKKTKQKSFSLVTVYDAFPPGAAVK